MPIFSRFNPGDISIKHRWVPKKRITLHSFKHKGYWYHWKNREKETMTLFGSLINEGDTVIEVGGHIGYISLYFSELVKNRGRVFVFEPGKNNLPYTRKNLNDVDNIKIIEKGVSDKCGKAAFYIENITGQNNSLVRNYELFNENRKLSYLSLGVEEVEIDVITLDVFCEEENVRPNFIKIDVEGAELEVVMGMLTCLAKYKPRIMVEVTKNNEDIFRLITDNDYLVFDGDMKLVVDHKQMSFNMFCFHCEDPFIRHSAS